MTAQQQDTTTTIEVWLRMNARGGITCETVAHDESTHRLQVDARSMGGAQREITGDLIRTGYRPLDQWGDTNDRGDECVRTFDKSGEA
jgi:hypothetical protein